MIDSDNIDERLIAASSVLVTSEVAQLLNITRQQVGVLTRNDELRLLRRTPQGNLYFRKDVDDFIRNRETLSNSKRNIRKFTEGIHYHEYLEEHVYGKRQLRAAFVFLERHDAAMEGFYDLSNTYYNSVRLVYTPSLVLRLDSEEEIWVSGPNCGYGGTGPSLTQEILRRCQVPEEYLPAIKQHDIVKLFLDDEGNIDIYTHESEFKREALSAKLTQNPDAHLVWHDGHLVMRQGYFPYGGDSLAVLEQYQKFVPNPAEVLLLTKEQAEDYGYFVQTNAHGYVEEMIHYTVIIRDTSGRELWLSPSVKESVKGIIKDDSLREVLEMCGFDVNSFSGMLKGWSMSFLRRKHLPGKKPLVIHAK